MSNLDLEAKDPEVHVCRTHRYRCAWCGSVSTLNKPLVHPPDWHEFTLHYQEDKAIPPEPRLVLFCCSEHVNDYVTAKNLAIEAMSEAFHYSMEKSKREWRRDCERQTREPIEKGANRGG